MADAAPAAQSMDKVNRSAETTEGVPVASQWYDDWVRDNIPDQSGRVAVVTGSNAGTGFWCAAALAGKGAQVVLACRSLPKAEAAKAEILRMHTNAKVEAIPLDNMDLGSVRAFATTFKEKYDRLDLLVNNAGIMAQPEMQSKDGYDVQFQTNHLAHFLLAALLWDRLVSSGREKPARVVQHSSGAHWMGGVKFDRRTLSYPSANASWCCFWACVAPASGYPKGPWKRYMMSKLCNVLFGLELQRRIEAAGLGDKVWSTMAHPGWASTQLQVVAGSAGNMPGWKKANEKNAQSAADGSLPLLMACVSEELKGGLYAGPSGSNESKGPPMLRKTGGNSKNVAMAKDLWSYSEECCGSQFRLKA